MLPIKRTIKKRFFEFNIFVYNALSRNIYLLRFEREYVSFKPRSAPETIVKSSILFLQVIENQNIGLLPALVISKSLLSENP